MEPVEIETKTLIQNSPEGRGRRHRGAYQAMSTMPGRSIAPETSAQKLLGVTPRTTDQWLADLGV